MCRKVSQLGVCENEGQDDTAEVLARASIGLLSVEELSDSIRKADKQ